MRQLGGGENEALRAWTGRDNAPIAVYEDEPGRDGWAEILDLAERLDPDTLPLDLCLVVGGDGWMLGRVMA